jgi:hypothetical protein
MTTNKNGTSLFFVKWTKDVFMSKTLDYFLDLYDCEDYDELIEFIENQGWGDDYLPPELDEFLTEWSC